MCPLNKTSSCCQFQTQCARRCCPGAAAAARPPPPPQTTPGRDGAGAGRRSGGGGVARRSGRARAWSGGSGPRGPRVPAPPPTWVGHCTARHCFVITDGSTTCTTYDKVSWSHGLSHRSLVSSADSLVKTKSAIMSEQKRAHSRGVTLLSI